MEVVKLFQLWNDHSVSNQELMKLLGITKHQFYAAKARHSLPRRPSECHIPSSARFPREVDPTPEEIEARAAAVRMKWTPDEEERRRVGPRAEAWRPPAFRFDYNGVLTAT
jgi:hypothetical protein